MERLKLNLVPGGVLTVCHASQYDNGRTVRFDLYDGDSKVTLAGTETITATLRKPSGAEVTLNVTNTSSDYVDVVTDSDTCDEAGVYLGELTVVSGSVKIGSANFILLAELDPYGQAQLVVRSASGSIVNFNTSVVENLIECIADFSATQAEGTPSPSVPIPIVGVSAVSVKHSGSDITDYDEYIINLGDTYYGGEVDATNGKLVVTHHGFTLTGAGEESWSVSNTGTANYFYVISLPTGSASAVGGSNIANIFPSVNIGSNNTTQGCYNTASAFRVRWGTEMTVADWKTWLETNNLTVVYKLATPIEYDLSDTANISALVGVNNVWSDTGDVAIKYYAKSTD